MDFRADKDFPTDDSGYGFDNIGDILTISPVLMEKYLNAAESISSRAISGLRAALLVLRDVANEGIPTEAMPKLRRIEAAREKFIDQIFHFTM